MNARVVIVLVGVVMLIACNEDPPPPVTPQRVEVNGLYAVSIPSNLEERKDMHDYAGLQYYDAVQDFYIMGIADEKAALGNIRSKNLKLSAYYNFVSTTVFSKTDSSDQISYYKFSKDGVKCIQGEYFSRNNYWNETFDLYYRILVAESETHFFQLMIWMQYEEYCDQLDWINHITNSFEVLDSTKVEPVMAEE